MPGGRPSKYNEDLINKAPQYLDEWEKEGDFIPSQAGLAVFLKISLSCLEKWATHPEKKEFLRVLDEIEAKQRNILINKGLAGTFNSSITKLVLTKHGYHDKQHTDLSSSDGTMTPSKNFNDFYGDS